MFVGHCNDWPDPSLLTRNTEQHGGLCSLTRDSAAMETAASLNILQCCTLSLVFVAFLQVGLAEKDGPFSLPEREK